MTIIFVGNLVRSHDDDKGGKIKCLILFFWSHLILQRIDELIHLVQVSLVIQTVEVDWDSVATEGEELAVLGEPLSNLGKLNKYIRISILR